MNKIVIASDSFKGSVSSLEIAEVAASAIHQIYPRCEVLKIPVADGGEGTVEALVSLTNGHFETCMVHDPCMKLISASYGILGDGHTAVIEMAAASGLPLVAPADRNPLLTTTYGTGELILDALQKGCTNFLIGIGGSATNDAGTGMLQALGFVFRDLQGKELKYGGQILHQIASVDRSNVSPLLTNVNFTIACDVNNPFCGKEGAAYIYARQKGADDRMIEDLDRGMAHFAEIIRQSELSDITGLPGAGAAGGLGGGFVAFLNGVLKPGIQMVLDSIDFETRIAGADLIITGEGRMDAQTCMGKAPVGILRAAKKADIPVIGLAGCVEETDVLLQEGFLAVFPLLPAPVALEKAMEKEYTLKNISRTVLQLMRLIQYYKK